MEEIAHGINEDPAWLPPAVGFAQALGVKGETEPLGEILGEAFHYTFGIAVLTPWTDLVASRCRVPGDVRPLDCGMDVGHGATLTQVLQYVYRRYSYSPL